MIVISGRLTVRPDQRDQAIAAATALVKATRAEEGYAEYTFSTDITDPNVLCFFEIWESEEAQTAHGKSAHMAGVQRHRRQGPRRAGQRHAVRGLRVVTALLKPH